MKKYQYLIVSLFLILTACSNSVIPLPPGTKQSKSGCPEEILHLGGTCYTIPKPHNDTIAWFEEKAKAEGWTLGLTTDDEPFSFKLTLKDKKATMTFYRQSDEKSTSLLVKFN